MNTCGRGQGHELATKASQVKLSQFFMCFATLERTCSLCHSFLCISHLSRTCSVALLFSENSRGGVSAAASLWLCQSTIHLEMEVVEVAVVTMK